MDGITKLAFGACHFWPSSCSLGNKGLAVCVDPIQDLTV